MSTSCRRRGYGPTSNSCAIIRVHYSTLEGTAFAYEGYHDWRDWAAYLEAPGERGLARFVECGCFGSTTICSRRPSPARRRATRLDDLNPKSLEVLTGCLLEPAQAEAAPGQAPQFERQGYFCPDPDSDGARLVFNRTVGLRDSWAKVQAKERAAG